MEKTRTTVRIAGRDYVIVTCDPEEHVLNVANWVDKRMHEYSQTTHMSSLQLAVLVAMNAADDMIKSREEIRRLRRELEKAQTEIELLKDV